MEVPFLPGTGDLRTCNFLFIKVSTEVSGKLGRDHIQVCVCVCGIYVHVSTCEKCKYPDI